MSDPPSAGPSRRVEHQARTPFCLHLLCVCAPPRTPLARRLQVGLAEMPQEVLILVLMFRPVEDRARCVVACRALRDAARAPPVWAELDLRRLREEPARDAWNALTSIAGPTLRSLRLGNSCELSDDEFARLVERCSGLRVAELTVRSRSVTTFFQVCDAGSAPFLRSTAADDPAGRSAIRLDLSNSRIGQRAAVTALSEALKVTEVPLAALLLAHTDIGYEGTRALADALKVTKAPLTELDLSDNDIYHAHALVAGLRVTEAPLAVLRLRGNRFGGPEGFNLDIVGGALCSWLKETKAPLALLDLSDNGIGPRGAAELAGALKATMAPLATLDLSGNPLDDAGLAALAGALKVTRAPLASLGLSGCRIGSDGARSLANALEATTAPLTTLRRGSNR